MKKIVCSVYCEDPTELRVLDTESYGWERFRIQEENLFDRCSSGDQDANQIF